MRILQAFANRGRGSQHLLDVRALQDRRIVSALPTPAGSPVSRLRAARCQEPGAACTLSTAIGCPGPPENVVAACVPVIEISAIIPPSLTA